MTVINTNVAASITANALTKNERAMSQAMERLSTGQRINNAGDDAAGLAIASRMTSQVNGLNMAVRNANDAISLVQTADGAIKEISSMLQRMRELAVQSESGALADADRDYLQLEVTQLFNEINAISANTKFNDTRVMTGASFTFYTDIDVAGTALTTVTAALYTSTLNIATATISIGGGETAANIAKVISVIDDAIAKVDNRRANLGAISNRFDHIIDNLTNVVANTEAARSRV